MVGITHMLCVSPLCKNPTQPWPNHPLHTLCHTKKRSRKTEYVYQSCVQMTSALYYTVHATIGISKQEMVPAATSSSPLK